MTCSNMKNGAIANWNFRKNEECLSALCRHYRELYIIQHVMSAEL